MMISIAGLLMLLIGCLSYLAGKPISWMVVIGAVLVFLGKILGEEL